MANPLLLNYELRITRLFSIFPISSFWFYFRSSIFGGEEEGRVEFLFSKVWLGVDGNFEGVWRGCVEFRMWVEGLGGISKAECGVVRNFYFRRGGEG